MGNNFITKKLESRSSKQDKYALKVGGAHREYVEKVLNFPQCKYVILDPRKSFKKILIDLNKAKKIHIVTGRLESIPFSNSYFDHLIGNLTSYYAVLLQLLGHFNWCPEVTTDLYLLLLLEAFQLSPQS